MAECSTTVARPAIEPQEIFTVGVQIQRYVLQAFHACWGDKSFLAVRA